MVMTKQREAQTSPGEVTYYYHNDHLMTTMFMSDEAGEVVWTMSQTPFDEQHVNEDPDLDGTSVTNPFRFPGQYSDGETDSMAWYNWNRFYIPSLGRYNRVDPKESVSYPYSTTMKANQSIGSNITNLYGYAKNNPIFFIDFTGFYPDMEEYKISPKDLGKIFKCVNEGNKAKNRAVCQKCCNDLFVECSPSGAAGCKQLLETCLLYCDDVKGSLCK